MGLDFRGHGGSDDGPTTFGVLEVEDVAGALAWLGERGIARVALVGSSMGGITAIAAAVVLGDGRLPAADVDPDAPAAPGPPPRRGSGRGRRLGAPELAVIVASRMRSRSGAGRRSALAARPPRGRRPAPHAAIEIVGLSRTSSCFVPRSADRTVPVRDARRLAAAAPPGTRHVVIEAADHGRGHATDPARYEAELGAHLRAAFAAARPEGGQDPAPAYT
jgi:pimeloyl-ACP methyl ester carboxylesterase